jgi:hypothetical protein
MKRCSSEDRVLLNIENDGTFTKRNFAHFLIVDGGRASSPISAIYLWENTLMRRSNSTTNGTTAAREDARILSYILCQPLNHTPCLVEIVCTCSNATIFARIGVTQRNLMQTHQVIMSTIPHFFTPRCFDYSLWDNEPVITLQEVHDAKNKDVLYGKILGRRKEQI